MRIKNILLMFAAMVLFSVNAFAQSPTSLKQKCPNTSVYSTVAISAVGDIKVSPCIAKTTTFLTGTNVDFTGTTVIGAAFASLSLPNGSAAAPALKFTNSTTTGFYRSAADILGIATAGVANSTFGGVVNTFRSASHVNTNVAGTAEFNETLTPHDTLGTFVVGDCTTTATTCLSLAQSGDTITFGSGTATTAVWTGTKSQQLQRTITAGGTTGNQTISKQAGTVNVAAANASIVVTNTTVTTSSIVTGVLRTADGTCTFIKSIVPTANTITITLNANCTAETSVGFVVWN